MTVNTFVMYVTRVSQETVHYEGIRNVISSVFSLGVRLWVNSNVVYAWAYGTSHSASVASVSHRPFSLRPCVQVAVWRRGGWDVGRATCLTPPVAKARNPTLLSLLYHLSTQTSTRTYPALP